MSKSKQIIKLVVWDWYKTLSSRHLYQRLEEDQPQAYETIQSYFLENPERMQTWKRGELGYDELHREFSQLTNVEKQIFDDALRLMASGFDVEERLLPVLDAFKRKGYEQVIVTDNYDKWDEFFLPEYSSHATQYFSGVYNSHKFRIARPEDSSQLVLGLIKERRLQPQEVLFIDDNKAICDELKGKGFLTICHKDSADLLEQLKRYV